MSIETAAAEHILALINDDADSFEIVDALERLQRWTRSLGKARRRVVVWQVQRDRPVTARAQLPTEPLPA